MAIILIFLSYFSFGQADLDQSIQSAALDSTKKERRERVLPDSAGRFLLINRVFIIGNRLTRDQIISRELSLKPGDLIYSLDLPEIIDLDKKKLINTRLFNTVEI